MYYSDKEIQNQNIFDIVKFSEDLERFFDFKYSNTNKNFPAVEFSNRNTCQFLPI